MTTHTATPTRPAAGAEPVPRTSPQNRLLRGYLHKTSNSLCGIKGYAGLILSRSETLQGTAKWAEKIIREVERMEEIFRSVGDLTRPVGEAGCGVGLAEVVGDAAAAVAARCPRLRCRARTLIPCDLLLPAADLGVILTALLENAAESRTPDDETVNVVVTTSLEPTGRVSLSVRDDGPGVPAHLLPQVAEPFLTTKEGHIGIGLSRVETLLDMYGLTWALWSEEDEGTVVTLEVGTPLD